MSRLWEGRAEEEMRKNLKVELTIWPLWTDICNQVKEQEVEGVKG